MKKWLLLSAVMLCLAAQSAGLCAPSFKQAVADYNAGHYAQALSAFTAIKAASPNNALTRYYLALCNQAMNRKSEAKAEYQWVSTYGDPTLKSHAAKGLAQLGATSASSGMPTQVSSGGGPVKAAAAVPTKVKKVLKFWAVWCGPCKEFAPIFDETKNKFRGITFEEVNIDEEVALKEKYGVHSIPHVVMLDGGGAVLYNGSAFQDSNSFADQINSYK